MSLVTQRTIAGTAAAMAIPNPRASSAVRTLELIR